MAISGREQMSNKTEEHGYIMTPAEGLILLSFMETPTESQTVFIIVSLFCDNALLTTWLFLSLH